MDKYLSPQSGAAVGTKTYAINLCKTQSAVVKKNGAITVVKKKLIDNSVYNLIIEDSSRSLYQILGISHWLSDPPVDIAPIFPNFDSSNPQGFNEDYDNPIFYQKPCTDSSCNYLSTIKGSDGEDFPAGSTIYISEDSYPAAARCYTEQ